MLILTALHEELVAVLALLLDEGEHPGRDGLYPRRRAFTPSDKWLLVTVVACDTRAGVVVEDRVPVAPVVMCSSET